MVLVLPMNGFMHRDPWRWRHAVAAGFLVALAARAETWALEATAAARILRIGNAEFYQDANYRNDILSVYHVGDNEQRSLLKFDLSPVVLPAGHRLLSARLRLVASTAFGGNPAGQPMEVWRVTQPWTESEVTWRNAFTGSPWNPAGGGFAGTGEGPFAVNTSQPGSNSPVEWLLTDLVEQWLDGIHPNHGLLLKSPAPNNLTFVQRESVPQDRPQLLLESAPGTPRLLVQLDAATGDVLLSWRTSGPVVLQQSFPLRTGAAWTAVDAPVDVVDRQSVVRIPSAGDARLFRLQSP